MPEKEKGFRVYGRVVIKETGRSVLNVIVEALDKDLIYDDRLGSVITDEDGNFEILYDREDFQEFFDRKPDIYLRVRKSDGKLIYTTEDKVRYGADRSEEFIVEIPRKAMEGEQEMKKANYIIEGKIPSEKLADIPKELKLKVYAVRDRKVIGSSPIAGDGSFSIQYKYEAFEKEEERAAIGTYLIAGPDMPRDAILGTKLQRVFMRSEAFREEERVYRADVTTELADRMFDTRFIVDLFEEHCRVWNPCVKVEICSSIEDGVCYGERDLANARVRIYAVRERLIYPAILGPGPYTVLVAEGDTDTSGRFWHEETKCYYPYLVATERTLGYRVEVGQIIDGAFHSIYMDPEDELRHLYSGVCEEILIDEREIEAEIVIPSEAEGELPGNSFKLTRIGNIPVGYIEQDPISRFHGYANTDVPERDSATLRVIDSAFCREIKLFANIGSGFLSGPENLSAVEFYRIKYSYDSGGTTEERYIRTRLRNLRESTPAEEPTAGPYITEDMGPEVGPDGERNVYRYPNPYDMREEANWVYKGLIMVFDTRTLPLRYGKFTFTIEPLDDVKSPVTVADSDDLSFTILVDNTAPTASIGDIEGPYGRAPACGFLELDGDDTYTACDGNTRNQLIGTVTVPYTVTDEHQNIYQIRVIADYGDVCDPNIIMQILDYTDLTVVPAAERPRWGGDSYFTSSEGKQTTSDVHGNPIPGSMLDTWDQCAYQFRVRVHKRVTNGERGEPCGYYWWYFTKHITIMAAPGGGPVSAG